MDFETFYEREAHRLLRLCFLTALVIDSDCGAVGYPGEVG